MLFEIYQKLLSEYGHQGWWPLLSLGASEVQKTGSHNGYHIENYSYPKTEEQATEIAIGAILTQNCSWVNAEKALKNLFDLTPLLPKNILQIEHEVLSELIRPAGYANKKAQYIQNLCELLQVNSSPSRDELLSIKGIGPETADCIMLYVQREPWFVVDAYTKRFLAHIGMIDGNESYQHLQKLFHDALPMDFKIFQEYHALLVEHGKQYYSRKPYGVGDNLSPKDNTN